MTLPSQVLTWQWTADQALAAQGSALADNKALILAMKNAWKAFGTLPLTVVRSSNGTTASNSDTWATVADLNFSNTTPSWLVGQMGCGAQVLISLPTSAAGQSMTIQVSGGGLFTGGTTTVLPTATDSSSVITSASWTSLSTDLATHWTMASSADGTAAYWIVTSAAAIRSVVWFQRPTVLSGAWLNAMVGSVATTGPTTTSLNSSIAARLNGTVATWKPVSEGTTAGLCVDNATFGNIANETNSEWMMYFLGIESDTYLTKGVQADLNDMWLGSTANSGTTYPAVGATWAQVGNLILPWNGGSFTL
jgi:hypothetical protein